MLFDGTNRIFVRSEDDEFRVVYAPTRAVYSNKDNAIVIKNNNKV